ncbi:hypothetical protein [Chitinophaga sp.]|uniref:hypothetical protein n=1 Tax=Chitinophaga sp. TaxID=1869181 RepID=UPI002F9476FC
MTYHNNDVTFSLKDNLTLIGGSFEVNDFSVSSGEDPDKHIYKGLKVSVESNRLRFRIGRHGSTETAKWFNLKVAAAQTTFNHSADKLNFALSGTLYLNISGGILAGRQQGFTFNNVMLAQGHAGANNWWFGGQNCTYIGGDKVKCVGHNANGDAVTFIFLRGGNGADTIELKNITILDTANWMRSLPDSKLLGEIMMPGSHDAGMSKLQHCSDGSGGIIGPFTKTQSKSVGEQLLAGSRYFDIRVDYDHSALVTYHRTDGNGCSGQYLKDVLDETVAFLSTHPREIPILKFSHIRNYKDHKKQDTGKLICEMLETYSDHMYKTAPPADGKAVNLATLPLSNDLRGKMLIVFSDAEFCDVAKGRFRYNDGTVVYNDVNLTVYDEYADEQNYDKMKKDQLDKWKKYGATDGKYFFLLSWTLTPKDYVIWNSIETLSAKANKELPAVLYDYIVSNKYSKPNIVYLDYLNETVTQSIIMYNF